VDLGQILTQQMERRGISAAALARRLRIKPPFVFAVRKGERGIPPKRADAWADALDLAGLERRAFIIAALLPRCPEQIQEYVRELEGRRKS
jgi:transcriptional regulator with XRE-family HTH domain